MSRERRSLWGSISQSKKVNSISVKAALLYTWAIPHFDDEGFQAGEPRDLKINIVPFRDDISIEEIKNLECELIIAGLWKIFHINSTCYICDPVWDQRQFFKGIHKIPSKIKLIIGDTPNTVLSYTQEGVLCHPERNNRENKLSEVKLSKEKLSKGKGSEEGKPKDLSHLSFEEKKTRLLKQAKEIGG